jgi:hypothetical protein
MILKNFVFWESSWGVSGVAKSRINTKFIQDTVVIVSLTNKDNVVTSFIFTVIRLYICVTLVLSQRIIRGAPTVLSEPVALIGPIEWHLVNLGDVPASMVLLLLIFIEEHCIERQVSSGTVCPPAELQARWFIWLIDWLIDWFYLFIYLFIYFI